MTFIVTGLSASGPALIGRNSPADAVNQAAEMQRTGYVDVLIADDNGLEYTPAEFIHAFH